MSKPPPAHDLLAAARTLDHPYTPRVVAQLNEMLFKVAWIQGYLDRFAPDQGIVFEAGAPRNAAEG